MERSNDLREGLLQLQRDQERLRGENDLLRRLIDELQHSEQDARQRADLLSTIVNVLPVGVRVEAEDGRLMLVNDVAAAQRDGATRAQPVGPDTLLKEHDVTELDQEAGLVCVGQSVSEEESIPGPNGESTLLISRKPVRVLDETLLLSTSVDITERKQVEKELLRRAYFDELTGLPNRSLIQERVEAVLRRKGPNERFALAFIDIDNFKHINDYYSHAIGDALLVKVAQRIDAQVRTSDTLARISGDEFVL